MLWKQFTHLGNFPPELKARFNSFLTTEFDDSLSVEMQLRSIIKWCQENFKTVDSLIDFINELSNWLKQFETNFDTKLEERVISVLSEWQASGQLDVVISEALQWELDDFKATTEQNFVSVNEKLDQLGYNVANNIDLVVGDDWTLAIQKALDEHTTVFIPFAMKHSGLVVKKFGATIKGVGSYYGGSVLEYTGSGIGVMTNASVEYIRLDGIRLKGTQNNPLDYYKTGSIGIDISQGNNAITMENSRIDGFETLINSNFNSFYNKFINNRFDKFKICLNKFNSNNLIFRNNRVLMFNNFALVNGSGGTFNINENSFEIFNGNLVQMTGDEKTKLSFRGNYVEVYDTIDLPSNFPTNQYSHVNKFGGNTLFVGNYSSFIMEDNEMQIRGLFRVATLSSCKQLRSVGNYYHLYKTGNNLDRLFSTPDLESFYVNDVMGDNNEGDGGYVRTYNQTALRLLDPKQEGYFFDPIDNKQKLPPQMVQAIPLQNGWKMASADYGAPRIFITKEGLYLQGSLDGSAKTLNQVAIIPEKNRPLEHDVMRTKANITAVSSYGDGEPVRFEYEYDTGVIRLVDSNSLVLSELSLDGAFIPIRM